MSRLQSRRDFEKEIADIDAMMEIDAELTDAHGGDLASQLMTGSLRQRRNELVRELDERGDERLMGHELDVVFEGVPVRGHAADADFIAAMLKDIQQLARGIVASVTGGAGRVGPLPQRVLRQSKLRLAETFPGSFGLRLETADPQLDLEMTDVSPLFTAMDKIVDLVASHRDEDDLLDVISPLSPRTRADYVRFLGHVARYGATVTVSWPTSSGPKTGSIGAAAARQRHRRLRSIREKTEGFQVDGRLDAAGIRRGYFEFITTDSRVLAGQVSQAILSDLDEFFNQDCAAYITATVIKDLATDEERVTYQLDQLGPRGTELFPRDEEEGDE